MPDVTAAGVPVKLTSGEILIITPYSQRDTMTVLKMVQRKNLNSLVAAIPKDLPKDLYRSAYAEAIKISKEFNIKEIGTSLLEMADEELLQTMIILAIQKTYKGDASKKALQILDNQDDFIVVMNAVNRQGEDEPDKEETEAKEGDNTSPPISVQP